MSFDETTTLADVADVAEILSGVRPEIEALAARLRERARFDPAALRRAGACSRIRCSTAITPRPR